jgi:hypothetical protein
LLSERFSPSLLTAQKTTRRLVDTLARADISGGAVYDALVALAAVEHDADLATVTLAPARPTNPSAPESSSPPEAGPRTQLHRQPPRHGPRLRPGQKPHRPDPRRPSPCLATLRAENRGRRSRCCYVPAARPDRRAFSFDACRLRRLPAAIRRAHRA